jgi:hypothetical protein
MTQPSFAASGNVDLQSGDVRVTETGTALKAD